MVPKSNITFISKQTTFHLTQADVESPKIQIDGENLMVGQSLYHKLRQS